MALILFLIELFELNDIHCSQAVARENVLILDAFAGWPGRAHDSVTFRGSKLCEELYSCTDGYQYILLGDKAYPVSEALMTPFPGDHDNLSQAEKDFNYSLSNVCQVCSSSNK